MQVAIVTLLMLFASRPLATVVSSEPRLSWYQLLVSSLQIQKEFCTNPALYRDPEAEARLKLTSGRFVDTDFQLYVYNSNDIVSQTIDRQQAWENTETQLFYDAIKRHLQRRGIADTRSATILDIGAQIGWYALGMAHKGFRVIAFEPMRYNLYMIRKSFCRNPEIELMVIGKALGAENARCYLYADPNNVGDPHMFCNQSDAGRRDINLGMSDVYRLDDFAELMGNLVAIKLDIEGFEHNVMLGGRKVLLDMHVPIIMSEFSSSMIRGKGGDPRAYLRGYEQAGYRMSTTGFDSGSLTIDQVLDEDRRRHIINLYLVHSSAM